MRISRVEDQNIIIPYIEECSKCTKSSRHGSLLVEKSVLPSKWSYVDSLLNTYGFDEHVFIMIFEV